MEHTVFRCRRFCVRQCAGVHPVGTDGLLLGAWADVTGAKRLLDAGTGTGLVALMLAQRTEHLEGVQICAVDTSAAARACAADNFCGSPWADRLQVGGGAVERYAEEAGAHYDLIASNPPFYVEATLSPLDWRRQSRSARSLGAEVLLLAASALLKPSGRLCVIAPPLYGRQLVERGAVCGLYLTRLTEVCPRPGGAVERWLVQLERSPYAFERSRLYLYTSEGISSPEYRALTKDFLL